MLAFPVARLVLLLETIAPSQLHPTTRAAEICYVTPRNTQACRHSVSTNITTVSTGQRSVLPTEVKNQPCRLWQPQELRPRGKA